MQFFELLGKTTGFNGGDHKIDVSVIGTNRETLKNPASGAGVG
jgi:hypothetical protein